MDRQWIYGILGALAITATTALLTWVVTTSEAGLDAAETKRIEDVIEANRVLTAEEATEIKGAVTRIDATLEASLKIQEKLLEAVLTE